MKKLAFVLPWYGEQIPGGAEAEARSLIHHLQDAGIETEVLTTCAKEFTADWDENFHPAGESKEAGVTVRRFPVNKRDSQRFDVLNRYLLKGVRLTAGEEAEFFLNSINSDGLCQYIREQKEAYSRFVFIPYLFGTTVFGSEAAGEKSVMIPCLHDECYAYTVTVRKMLERQGGILFNAEPEQKLAETIADLSAVPRLVMGIGLDTDWSSDAERFRRKYGITEPFILYAGRKDVTKNVDALIQYFAEYKRETKCALKLVMIGPAKLPVPESVREDVIDLGFVPEQDKYDAYAAALLLCQPSKNESFSLVMMESWLAGRPVMVHRDCRVTSDFVVKADGGFYFSDYDEFFEQVSYLLKHPEIAEKLGQQGREFVKSHFSWDIIVDTVRKFLEMEEHNEA